MSFGLQPLLHWFRKPAADAPLGRWVVVDTETSGLDPHRDRLLAIGGIAVDDDGILLGDSFEVIVNGEPSGDAANIVVHGIGHGAQATGTPARDALTAFRAWAGDAPRVGFHTDFDGAVLRVADTGAGLPADDRPWLDLAQLAGALAPRGRQTAVAASTTGCRRSTSNARSGTTRRPTHSPPPSSCCACASSPGRRARPPSARSSLPRASNDGWGTG